MNDETILIDFDTFDVEKKKYLGITMYDRKAKCLIKCFVEHNDDIYDYLTDNMYEDVHNNLSFKITKDGKIKLDFRL